MKHTVTEKMLCGDIIREVKREYEFDTFEDFQEYLFLSGAGADTEDIVSDIILGMASPEDEDDDEEDDD